MNKDIKQTLSQFLDDELETHELDGLLKAIKQQPELKGKIYQYQVVKQAMQAENSVMVEVSFLDKVKQQIEQEPHYLLPKKAIKKNSVALWQKASFAVAASVACVAVIISQQNPIQQSIQPQQLAVADIAIVGQSVQKPSSTQLSQHERLKAYLLAHNDDLYTHGSLNVHPLARTANYSQD